ncbi:MAG: hypothetical protein Q8Q01_05200 [archaeon]|nr:hypothetical protein [archaeon]
MTNDNSLEGKLHLHSETGTEGGYWAFQDSQYIFFKDRWSYERLHILVDGDQLSIFNPDDKDKIIWSVVITLTQHPQFTEDVNGYWIHADQIGIDREVWAEYFLKKYSAKLIPFEKQK